METCAVIFDNSKQLQLTFFRYTKHVPLQKKKKIIIKATKKIQFKLSFLDIQCIIEKKKCTFIALYGDSAYQFAFSTFLTIKFFKTRERPQTIFMSKNKFNIFLLNKHHLIKIYDQLIRVVYWLVYPFKTTYLYYNGYLCKYNFRLKNMPRLRKAQDNLRK